jgi:hypothetical protein
MHIPCVELGQHGKLLVVKTSEFGLKLRDASKQLGIRSGSWLLDHIFDSTESNANRQP